MTFPRQLVKAQLQQITWSTGQETQTIGSPIDVQFNPESLKLSFSNQKAGGDQRGGAATQYVGQGTTKLSFDLWFDVTAPVPDLASEPDVRLLTAKIGFFITPKKTGDKDKFIAPGCRFIWGAFKFDGTMDSLNETLEYFSEDGYPLRANLSVALSQQEIKFHAGQQASPGLGLTVPPGTVPQAMARQGDTFQSLAAATGRLDQWQLAANRNDIENPRRIPPGTPLNLLS